MKVLSVKEMKSVDEYTCRVKDITPLDLMERAGSEICRCMLEMIRLKNTDQILVVSGLGNNGGDGLVSARLLLEQGYNVKVVLVGDRNKLSNCTKTNLNRLISTKTDVFYLEGAASVESFKRMIGETDVILEGIFGIGLNREVGGVFYDAIKAINESQATVVSIDIPSGIDGDNGNRCGISVEADATVIIQNYKIGNLLNDAKDVHGKTKVVDIGLVSDGVRSQKYLLDVKELNFKKRKNNSHKYDYGSVLTVGGSPGMTGAPLMCAYAGLRTGSGLSTIAIREDYIKYVNNIYPEVMVQGFDDDDFENVLAKKDVIAFGPGLGRNDDYTKILKNILDTGLPVLVDADGLFHLKKCLHEDVQLNDVVVTPHAGEMSALLDVDIEVVRSRPLECVERLTERGMTVVLKGPCTVVADSEEMSFCPWGNPGMATAGSGDVLAGIITSLIGQGYKLIDACKLGVYVHSKSGDAAAEKLGQYSITATDIIAHIPPTLMSTFSVN